MPALETLPRKIGPYRVLEKIGEGGMGVVYLATDSEKRRVAVKVLGPAVAADPDARLRLAREVETMRRVRNRHVAEVLDADITGSSPYIVTRYVPGRTLQAAVTSDGPLSGKALDTLAVGLAEALAAIHAAGVIHRDLKPANVMLDDGQPVIIDFGIAHVADGSRLTKTGLVMGTPGYVAPEVIEGQPSSGASDVHAWAATVAFAATGRPPYGSGNYQTLFYRVLEGRPDLAGIPPRLLRLIAGSLVTDPAARPTAAWLAVQCAADAGNMTRPDGTGLDGTRLDGTRFDGTRLDGTRLDGTRVNSTHVDPPRRYWDGQGIAGVGAAPPAPPAAPAPARAYPAPAQAAQAVADLLPPVDYSRQQPPSAAPGSSGLPGRPATGATATGATAVPASPPSGGHGLVMLALGVAAVSLSVLLPVAGTILALAVIALLRAVDHAQLDLAGRRSLRGPRPSDIFIVLVKAPWTVAGALLKMVLLAPFALVVAAAAAAVAVAFARAGTLPAAGAWAAGAAVAFYCVGPGSRAPRRQLRRIVTAVIPTRSAMLVAYVSSWALALAVISSAISQPPLIWPATSSTLPHLLPSLNVLPSLGGVLHSVQRWLLGHTVGMLHLP